MIKAIITDVDGVIVGDKNGVNFPLPNERVIERLKAIKKSGIPVILCTGKPTYATEDIIRKAELDNPHITDAGAFIYNPLQNQIIKEHTIAKDLSTRIGEISLKNNFYLEIHTSKGYYVQKDQVYELTDTRISILQKEPFLVDSLLEIIPTLDIIKILAFTKTDTEKSQLETILDPFNDAIHAIWSTVPIMRPAMARVITRKGVSKMHASQEVLDYLGIAFDECLGVGDLPPDWLFIKHCRYGGVVGDSDQEFKNNVISKGEGNYFLGSSVDENGFLQILDYFKL